MPKLPPLTDGKESAAAWEEFVARSEKGRAERRAIMDGRADMKKPKKDEKEYSS